MIKGINHITLVVGDIEKSARIITGILGGQEIYDSIDRNFSLAREKFFDVNGLWLVLMSGQANAAKSYNHIAFSVESEDLPELTRRVEALGLEVRPPRSRVAGEGESLYFYDFDNHLFELHTGTLQERMKTYRQAVI